MTDAEVYAAILDACLGLCEACGKPGEEFHHVARGACKTTDLCCVLYLCRACHNLWHRTDGETQRAVCLALLELSRPQHADLERYYQLTHRRFPSRACVAAWRAVLNRRAA